jgi:hypothetical protein
MQEHSEVRQSSGIPRRPLDAAAYVRRSVKLAFTVPTTLANPWSGFRRTHTVKSR